MVSIVRSGDGSAGPIAVPGRPWELHGSVDVEQLVQWAYGAQMVDRFERVGLNAIEAAVSGFEPRAMSTDGVGQMMLIGNLGCRIDNGGVRISDAVHPVAYAVAQAVRSVDGGERIRFHALTGTRPRGWVEPTHKVRPVVWVKPGEKAQVEYQGPGRKGGYCQVIFVWDAQREAWGRSDYARWWRSLSDLAWQLSRAALGFVVTGPAAPPEPWHPPAGPPKPFHQQ